MDRKVQYGEHDEDSIIPAVAAFVAGATMDRKVQYGEHDEDSIISAVAVFVADATMDGEVPIQGDGR